MNKSYHNIFFKFVNKEFCRSKCTVLSDSFCLQKLQQIYSAVPSIAKKRTHTGLRKEQVFVTCGDLDVSGNLSHSLDIAGKQMNRHSY